MLVEVALDFLLQTLLQHQHQHAELHVDEYVRFLQRQARMASRSARLRSVRLSSS